MIYQLRPYKCKLQIMFMQRKMTYSVPTSLLINANRDFPISIFSHTSKEALTVLCRDIEAEFSIGGTWNYTGLIRIWNGDGRYQMKSSKNYLNRKHHFRKMATFRVRWRKRSCS